MRWLVCTWLGAVALALGCLNPQPDTNPLGPEAAPAPVAVDVSPPAPVPVPSAPDGNLGFEGESAGGSGSQPPAEAASDAGVAPEADGGSSQPPISVTFSVADAGALLPDAGPPDAGDD